MTVRADTTELAFSGLRRQADNFVDLADLSDIIGRPSRLPGNRC